MPSGMFHVDFLSFFVIVFCFANLIVSIVSKNVHSFLGWVLATFAWINIFAKNTGMS